VRDNGRGMGPTRVARVSFYWKTFPLPLRWFEPIGSPAADFYGQIKKGAKQN
jgi:hypothetical protein